MSNEAQPEKAGQPPVSLQIEMDEQTAQGVYANLAILSHTENEFALDFIFLQPQQPKARVRARIISSPGHTKQFLSALQENIQRYEKAFGPIKAASPPEKKIGFSKS